MQKNKFYTISFLLFLVVGCKKNLTSKESNKIQDTARIQSSQEASNLSPTTDDSNTEKSFVISCGSGCAMTYNVKDIVRNGNEIKVDFIVEMYIDEMLQETQRERYFFYYDNSNTLIKIKKEGEDESFLETQTQDTQESFTEFGYSLIKGRKRNFTAEKSAVYDITTNPKTVKYNLVDISSIKNLSKFSCDEINARYISLPNKEEVHLFLVPQDCGDFDYRYYLLTVKNNSVISDLYVEGIWQEPEDEDSKEITTFKIDHNFNIIVQTKLSNSSKSVEYRITKDGKIVKI